MGFKTGRFNFKRTLMTDTIDFKEVQRFKIWWAWLGIASLNLVFLFAIVQQLILGKPFGPKPAPDHVLIIVELFFLLLLCFLMTIKLKTRINDTGIYFRFYPFQFTETLIEWQELKEVYLRTYNSFYEYGGWGIRTGTKETGRAINTSASSNTGLQLLFNNGHRLLIGTRKPGELQLVIDALTAKGKINRGVQF
jgi:hypothetical protein